MNPAVLLAVKAVSAGVFVALLSHLTSATRPKLFSGLFAAAPTVATTSLVLISLKDPTAGSVAATGMISGALGLLACCAVVPVVEQRANAMVASAFGWVAWAVVALGVYAIAGR